MPKLMPPKEVAALMAMPRASAEAFYAAVWQRNDRRAIRWLCRNDRYFLLSNVLRRPDVRDDWIYARIREVEQDPDGYLDLWAREHYKSSAITFAGSIQEILKNPEITIGIFSHIRPAAKDFLVQIKLELEDNELLLDLFPEIFWKDPKTQAPTWGEDSGLIVKRKGNPREATVEAWGLVDGMPTGKHYLLRIYDDLVTEKAVTTVEMIKKVTEAFDLSEYLGVRKGGRIWIVGTRYHWADTYGKLLKRGLYFERRYPATHNGKFDGTPVFLTQEEWDRELKKPRSVVAAQMLLNPIEGSEKKFDPRWLQFWLVRPKKLNVYIMADASKGMHVTSDSTAIVVLGMDVARNKYLLDGWCHRMPLSRRWQLLRDCHKKWARAIGVEYVRVGYEQFGMQTDIEYFKERMEHEKYYFPIEELKWPRSGPKSKAHRIERLEPDIRMGRMRLPGVIEVGEDGSTIPRDISRLRPIRDAKVDGEAWRCATHLHKMDEDGKLYDFMMKLLEEFCFFPAGPDDILDAWSRFYDMEPNPPIAYDSSPLGEMPLEPEVFIDGV